MNSSTIEESYTVNWRKKCMQNIIGVFSFYMGKNINMIVTHKYPSLSSNDAEFFADASMIRCTKMSIFNPSRQGMCAWPP